MTRVVEAVRPVEHEFESLRQFVTHPVARSFSHNPTHLATQRRLPKLTTHVHADVVSHILAHVPTQLSQSLRAVLHQGCFWGHKVGD